MFFRRSNYRFTDLVAAICIPATVFLTFYVTSLTRDLQEITSSYVVLQDSSLRRFSDEIHEDKLSPTRQPILPLSFEDDDRILVAPPLNNTGKSDGQILILTSLPRSGQGLLRQILKELKTQNQFLIIAPPLKEKQVITLPSRSKQKLVADRISSLNGSNLIMDYFAFINFTEFGHKQPIQVSFVRDPVERAISLYYYARAPQQVVERYRIFPSQKLPSRQFLKKSLEACLMDPTDAECSYEAGSEREGHTIQYFCGHEDYCSLFADERGFERAQEVVEEKFAVVGLLEELDKTMVILEQYVPKFFKGAYQVYQKIMSEQPMPINQNMYKPPVEKSALKKFRKKFRIEQKFYAFLKNRLDKQYEKILQRSQINRILKHPV